MSQDKKSFMLYYDYREHLALLTDEERGQLFMALLDYGEFGTVPELGGATRMAFSFIRAQLDRDASKWQAKAEAGRQGGISSGKSRKADASTSKQNEAEPSERSVTVTVTGTVTDTVTGTEIPPTPKGASAAPVPFAKIMQLYNDTCTSFPKIKVIDGQRKKAVTARWATFPDLATFETLFRKTEASAFMKGQNDKSWRADFDWIVKPTNMAKVLEGKYDNERSDGHGKHQGHPDRGSPADRGTNLEGFEVATGDDDWGGSK